MMRVEVLSKHKEWGEQKFLKEKRDMDMVLSERCFSYLHDLLSLSLFFFPPLLHVQIGDCSQRAAEYMGKLEKLKPTLIKRYAEERSRQISATFDKVISEPAPVSLGTSSYVS
jgi:hypothetical protein